MSRGELGRTQARFPAVGSAASTLPPGDFDADEKLAAILGTPAPGTHAPVLGDLLQRPIPARVRVRVAAELAKHGVRAGVEALVAQFAAFAELDNDDEARVALALNEIAGTKLVEVDDDESPRAEFGPKSPIPREVRFDKGPGVVKDDEAGAERVRLWWAENAERLRFDDATGRGTTAK